MATGANENGYGIMFAVGATWSGAAVVAIGALLASSLLAVLAARREAYKRVLDALDFMASPAVADARHQMGAIVNQKEPIATLEASVLSGRIAQLFVLTWAAQRLAAVRRSLGPSWTILIPRPHVLLRDSTGSWITYWMTQPAEEECGKDVPASILTRLQLVADRLQVHLDEDDYAGFEELHKGWGTKASKLAALPPTHDQASPPTRPAERSQS